jgi:hypothetical protein
LDRQIRILCFLIALLKDFGEVGSHILISQASTISKYANDEKRIAHQVALSERDVVRWALPVL